MLISEKKRVVECDENGGEVRVHIRTDLFEPERTCQGTSVALCRSTPDYTFVAEAQTSATLSSTSDHTLSC